MTGSNNTHQDLAELLDRSGSPLVLAELHGGLCGVICAGGPAAASQWLEELMDDCTADSETLGQLAQQLTRLGAATWEALNGATLQFAPLLPDQAGIDAQADGLALWCHGFLAGLVIGGLDLTSGQTDLPAELTELVGDFAEISKAGADADDLADADMSEESLTELVEFVRVGVQFIFEELTPGPSDLSDQRVLH